MFNDKLTLCISENVNSPAMDMWLIRVGNNISKQKLQICFESKNSMNQSNDNFNWFEISMHTNRFFFYFVFEVKEISFCIRKPVSVLKGAIKWVYLNLTNHFIGEEIEKYLTASCRRK